ncbi:hypothetical protein FRC05_008808 [Tulasnella sp. 425]|nr:hypothetical protein FRC05_008808 [Tulasnella sp. 425]
MSNDKPLPHKTKQLQQDQPPLLLQARPLHKLHTADPQIQEEKQPGTEEPHVTQVSGSCSSARLKCNDSVAPPATQIVTGEDLDASNSEPAYEADEVYVNFPPRSSVFVITRGRQVGAPDGPGRVSVEGVMKNGNLSGRFAYELDMTRSQQGFPVPGPAQPPEQTGVAGTSLSPKKGQKNASVAAGPSNAASQLRQQQYIVSQKAIEPSRMMAGLAKVDDSARRATVLDALRGENILELPVHEDLPSKAKGQLKNDLLHRQAYYFNIATKTPQSALPAIRLGAIMADSMGLGNTLTMLSLIFATWHDVPSGQGNATLIVVPLSVLSNWTTRIDDHVTEGTLRTYVYHGDGRAAAAEAIGRYDETVSRDWKGGKPAAPTNKKPGRMGDCLA